MHETFEWGLDRERLAPVAPRESQLFSYEVDFPLSEGFAELREKTSKEPHDIQAWHEFAALYRRHFMYRNAINVYSRALCTNAMSDSLHYGRGHAYLNCDCLDEAIADFRMAARLNMDHFNNWYCLGIALYLAGNYDNAVKACERALEFGKSNDDIITASFWYSVGLFHLGRQRDIGKLESNLSGEVKPGRSHQFYRAMQLFRGKAGLEDVADALNDEKPFSSIVRLGAAYYLYYVRDDRRRSVRLLESIIRSDAETLWSGYAYKAARIQLDRLREEKE